MDEIIKNAGNGYRIGNKHIKIICCADAAVILSIHEHSLQEMLHKFETTAKFFNVIITTPHSVKGTKMLVNYIQSTCETGSEFPIPGS